MEPIQIIILVIGVLLFAGIIACVYFGRDYLRYHKVFAPVVQILCTTIKGISGMLPNNATLLTLSIVLNAAVEATTLAEKLWLDCTIDKEQRNHYAKNYIASLLEKANIESNDNIEAVINGAIAFVCYLLPHGQQPEEKEEV